MFTWVHAHIHSFVAALSTFGVVCVTVAANTTGLLPASIGAWLTAIGSIIAVVVSHVVVPPVAHKLSARFKH